MQASRCSRKGSVSESTTLPCASRTRNSPLAAPIDSALPESSVSTVECLALYSPNLSDDEPLLSARTVRADRLAVMEIPVRRRRRSGSPLPVPHFGHVLAMLADVAPVTLHRALVTIN